jgi:hypothetical protein
MTDAESCEFSSAGRCGFHNELADGQQPLFVVDPVLGESSVTVEASSPRYQRRLAARHIVSGQRAQGEVVSQLAFALQDLVMKYENGESQLLPLSMDVAKMTPLRLQLNEIIQVVTHVSEDRVRTLWSIEARWKSEAPIDRVTMPRSSSLQSIGGDGYTTAIWRLFNDRPELTVKFADEYVGTIGIELRFRTVGEDSVSHVFTQALFVTIHDTDIKFSLSNGLVGFNSSAVLKAYSSGTIIHSVVVELSGCAAADIVVASFTVQDELVPILELGDEDLVSFYRWNVVGGREHPSKLLLTPRGCKQVQLQVISVSALTMLGDPLTAAAVKSSDLTHFQIFWIHLPVDDDLLPVSQDKESASIRVGSVAKRLLYAVADFTPLRVSSLNVAIQGDNPKAATMMSHEMSVKPGDGEFEVSIDVGNTQSWSDLSAVDILRVNHGELRRVRLRLRFEHELYPDELFEISSVLLALRQNEVGAHRRLEDTTNSALEPQTTVKTTLWPVVISTVDGRLLSFQLPSLFGLALDDYKSQYCESTATLFDVSSSSTISLRSNGTPVVETPLFHGCNDTIILERHQLANSTQPTGDAIFVVRTRVRASPGDDGVVVADVELPITWRSLPPTQSVNARRIEIVGSADIPLGNSVLFKVSGESVPITARVEVILDNCTPSLSAVATALSTSEALSTRVNNCTVLLHDDNAPRPLELPVQVQLAQMSSSSGVITLTLQTALRTLDREWSSSSLVTAVVELLVCDVVPPRKQAWYFQTTQSSPQLIPVEQLMAPLFSSATKAGRLMKNVSIVWARDAPLAGAISTSAVPQLLPTTFNQSADFVSFAVDESALFGYASNKSETVVVDILVGWETSGPSPRRSCTVLRGLRIATISTANSAASELRPFVFSTKAYSGVPAIIHVPIVGSSRFTPTEHVRLDLYSNRSDQMVLVERYNGSDFRPVARSPGDLFPIISNRSDVDGGGASFSGRHMDVRITPSTDFTGGVHFTFVLSVLDLLVPRSDFPFLENNSSASVIYEQTVEWISLDFTTVQPPSPRVAVYRSLPIQLWGEGLLSFKYRTGSGMNASIISGGTIAWY